jgi:hypothetical protein
MKHIANDEIKILAQKRPFCTERSVSWMCERDFIYIELFSEHRNIVVKISRPRRIQKHYFVTFFIRRKEMPIVLAAELYFRALPI